MVEVRPDIVYCQAHGYPTGGPRQDDPAYDDVIQAESGLADAVARVAGQPMLAPTVLADKVCSLTIVYSVTAALYRRARSGEGEHIEVPMQETFEAFTLVEHGAEAVPRPPGRAGRLPAGADPAPSAVADPGRVDGGAPLHQGAVRPHLCRHRPG